MQIYNFQRILEACDLYEEALTPQMASKIFYVCGKLR
jgi:hypothetical protein